MGDPPSFPLFNQPLLLDRPIAFHRCLVTIAGSVTAALMLSQALYWQKRCPHDDGWWWKTMENWTEETGLSRREQENARRRLRNAGLLTEELRGVPATLHFHVDLDTVNRRLQGVDAEPVDVTGTGQTSLPQTAKPDCTKRTNQFAPNVQTSLHQTAKLDCTKPPNQFAPFGQTTQYDPETTTEITSETTTPPNAEPAAAPEPESGGGELIFDFNLTPLSAEERERARETLHGLSPELAQQVLDEWNHAHACHSIRQSRWGWLRKVADIARSGQFIPSADLAEQRRAQQQRPAAAPGDPPSRRQPSPVWQAQRDRIRSLFPEEECSRYIAPLRGQEQDGILWLEAPNTMVAAWVKGRLPHIIETLQPYTDLPVQLRVG